ncbi:hypothetical protein SY2F82_35640 [Streptomyces sp. Y2F8-2]|nr:hypothetical protein SY2F82_35640 [Streptomyces sp. Y2F8-2]
MGGSLSVRSRGEGTRLAQEGLQVVAQDQAGLAPAAEAFVVGDHGAAVVGDRIAG